MKKSRILVSLLAFVLAVSVVGGCFALYIVNATDRNITIGTGDAITLAIGNAPEAAITGLNPTNPVTCTINLQSSAVGAITEDVQGKFYVEVATGTYSTYLKVNALVTEKDGITEHNVAHDDLTSVGYTCKLADLPETVKLTFSLEGIAGADFLAIADQTATVTLHWEIDDSYESTWEIDADAYYLVGNIGGFDLWTPNSDTYKLSLNTESAYEEYMIMNVYLTTTDEFKIYKQNGNIWRDGLEDDVVDAEYVGGWASNLRVKANGYYNIYLKVAVEGNPQYNLIYVQQVVTP
ncbi:MAG: hypothetical protein IJZ28_02450 [Clostridia bacterium]|nr:hypothetical protein [Clostridia bacterium]MBQ8772040.1 hypothetical protein [Clostridia bacterium]MBQ8873275.1 hypothetical protein [Clostridia bacterium]